ncbi:MAG: esterase-like activity of phytase family protein [Acidimicrobiia bacterium]
MRSKYRRGWWIGAATTVALAAIIGAGVDPSAAGDDGRNRGHRERGFEHVGTFDVRANGTEVAEIVDATKDGETLVYTDSSTGRVGFVDISNPAAPVAAGTILLGGEPTSVAIMNDYALVAVDFSAGNFVNPSGTLFVIDLETRAIVREIDLGGQPDSVAIAPNQQYATIIIENQRNEDLNDGLIPQLPAGNLTVLTTRGKPSTWTTKVVDLTNLPGMTDGTDPEPEYADINSRNQAVVTLQENNHLAIVDLRTARVISSFSAGTVDLTNIDATEDELGPQGNGTTSLVDSLTDRRREPDTVQWLTNSTFAIANEGDYEDADGDEGGSRGFTVFDIQGHVVHESYAAFEYEQIRAGHYNEGRSENKGGEPEAMEYGTFSGEQFLFVGAERTNSVGVYELGRRGLEFRQLLSTGIGPEGMKAIARRNLLAVAAETSVDDLIPSMITIYAYQRQAEPSMTLVSDDVDGLPIPWVAMSGLAGDPVDADTIYGVTDSFLAETGIYTIDVSSSPARITGRIVVSDAGGVRNDLDAEGIAVAPEGGFWIASEGRTNAGSSRPNALVRVDAAGVVQQEVQLPADLLAAGLTSSGFEGVAVTATSAGTSEYVYAVIQREWASDAAGRVKIGRYDVANDAWTFVSYTLDGVPAGIEPWVGLSEITLLPDGAFAIIERDNQIGALASVKKVYGVDLASAEFRPFGQPLVTVGKVLLADLVDELADNSIYTPDKLEGLTVAADGQVYVVTDNDGLDDALGQTVFLGLGDLSTALAG